MRWWIEVRCEIRMRHSKSLSVKGERNGEDSEFTTSVVGGLDLWSFFPPFSSEKLVYKPHGGKGPEYLNTSVMCVRHGVWWSILWFLKGGYGPIALPRLLPFLRE